MTPYKNSERVVVTGIGAITPLGLTTAETWDNLVEGRSGIAEITSFDVTDLPVRIAGEVKGFDPQQYMDYKESKRMARFSQFAVAAASMALADAGLAVNDGNADRVGAVINTGGGGFPETYDESLRMQRRGAARVSPFWVPIMAPNMASCQPSIVLGLRGPIITGVAACASSVYAFADAYHILRRNEADALLVGGAEAGLSALTIAALANMQALSKNNEDPQGASRPFDRDRDGFVLGEGSVVMVVEQERHALNRGARILAEIVGGAITGDAYHITMPAPQGAGAARAMQQALAVGDVKPQEVDYICAHGTGTPLNDVAETAAIKQTFGKHAKNLAISSPKSMVGHLLGAAGALSALVSIMAIVKGIVTPTINLDHPDPACDLDYIPHCARHMAVRTAMINGFGFGGQNAVTIFRAYDG
ncbi:MAG: beta-ketoacyl-ACP synthase II [Dehalococcoidia bacterium]